ncbi:hypothetical protein GCM10018965_023900 [Nonomuraea roseola]
MDPEPALSVRFGLPDGPARRGRYGPEAALDRKPANRVTYVVYVTDTE